MLSDTPRLNLDWRNPHKLDNGGSGFRLDGTGYVVFDLDSQENLPLVEKHLPKTDLIVGLTTGHVAHYYFRCEGKGRRYFRHPTELNSRGVRRVLFELRAKGLQVLPPSPYRDGGSYIFLASGEPSRVHFADLLNACREIWNEAC